MKRTFILEQIRSHISAANLRGSIGEIKIRSLSLEAKSRTFFLAECTREQLSERTDALSDFLEAQHPGQYSCAENIFQNIDGMLAEIREGDDGVALENNWRCRLMRPEQFDFSSEERLKETTMNATWRVFITHDPRGYSTRHDIYPALWYPGYSIGVFPDYRNGLRTELKTISRDDGIIADRNFDVVKLFVKSNPSKNYSQIGTSVPVADLIENLDQITGDFIRNAEVFFGQIFPGFSAPQQTPINVGTYLAPSGTSYALLNIAGVQVTGAPCPGNPANFVYDPITNSWRARQP